MAGLKLRVDAIVVSCIDVLLANPNLGQYIKQHLVKVV